MIFPPNYLIWIFTHLKLCLDTAAHALKITLIYLFCLIKLFSHCPHGRLNCWTSIELNNWIDKMKWNEWGFRPIVCTYRLNWARKPPEDRKMRWHYPPDTGFEIWTSSVWGRTRYLSVTEAPHNIKSLRVSGEETFCFFKNLRPEWGSNPRSSRQLDSTTAPGPQPNLTKRSQCTILDQIFIVAEGLTRHLVKLRDPWPTWRSPDGHAKSQSTNFVYAMVKNDNLECF